MTVRKEDALRYLDTTYKLGRRDECEEIIALIETNPDLNMVDVLKVLKDRLKLETEELKD